MFEGGTSAWRRASGRVSPHAWTGALTRAPPAQSEVREWRVLLEEEASSPLGEHSSYLWKMLTSAIEHTPAQRF